MRTPQDFKRENIKAVFDKVLKSKKITLTPKLITITENSVNENTFVDFSFTEKIGNSEKTHEFSSQEGSGFVDAVFTACSSALTEDYPSLGNISLIGLNILPSFSSSHKTTASDASVAVTFSLKTRNNGRADFTSECRSIISASFQSILKSFEFYANCDKSFVFLQSFLKDAKSRNRHDIVQGIVSDMSILTTVNTYA